MFMNDVLSSVMGWVLCGGVCCGVGGRDMGCFHYIIICFFGWGVFGL